MTYQSHRVWGVAFGVLLYPYGVPHSIEDVIWYVGWLAICLVFSVLPDIDHPHSWLGRRIPVIPSILFKTTGHRGMTHSLLAAGVVYFVLYYGALYLDADETFALFIARASFVGYISHIASDFLTNRGVSLLWPIPGRIGISLAATGSQGERVMTMMMILSCAIYLVHGYGEFFGVPQFFVLKSPSFNDFSKWVFS